MNKFFIIIKFSIIFESLNEIKKAVAFLHFVKVKIFDKVLPVFTYHYFSRLVIFPTSQ